MKKLTKYKVTFLTGKKMKFNARSRNHAHGLASQYGLVSKVEDCTSWLLSLSVYGGLAALGYAFFRVLAGQLGG